MPSKSTALCEQCAKPFPRRKSGRNLYCSSACYRVGRVKSVAERLWRCVDRNEICWVRDARPNAQGYTEILSGGKISKAHRVAWELATGETLTDDHVIGHTCDNPPCVRNDEVGIYVVDGIAYPRRGHLFKALGNGANNKDKAAKGRARNGVGGRHGSKTHPERIARGLRNGTFTKPERRRRGESHGRAKLTEAQVLVIRQTYASGTVTLTSIASQYGLTLANISAIVHGRTWKHLL